MSDLGYWLVMAFMAVLVVVATGGVTGYAYFSQDRWGKPKPKEVAGRARDKVADVSGSNGKADERDQVAA